MFESVCGPGEVTVAGVQHADPFALAAALAPLTEDALMTLTADEAECVVAATQRVVNAMAARQAVAVDRYTQHVGEQAANADPGRGDERRVLTDTAAMLAPILRIAPRTMVSRIEAARWGGCLPRTSAAAWAGDLEPYRVAAITTAAMTLGFDDLVEFEARLFDRDITDLAAARVKDRAVKIAHRLAARHPDPDPVLPRWVRTTGDEHPGCTRWSALLPTDRSARMWAAIDTLAGEYLRANPALSVAEARADAFGDLLLGNAHVTAEVTIVLPADHAPYSQENPLDEPGAPTATNRSRTPTKQARAPRPARSSRSDRGGDRRTANRPPRRGSRGPPRRRWPRRPCRP